MNFSTSHHRALVAAPLLLLLAVACGQPAAVHDSRAVGARGKPAEPKASPSPSPLESPPLPPAQGGPLPGQNLPLSAPLPYPLLVQIENTPPSRPQAGIDAASLVFQYLTESDITRFSAIYHRVPGVIGPVRSARYISIYLYHHFDAVMLASGAGTNTYHRVFSEKGTNAFFNDFDPVHFFRWGGRAAPHNVYTSQAQLLTVANAHLHPDLATDIARSTDWPGTAPAPHIDVPSMRASFDYNNGSYSVVTDGIPQTDVIYGDVRAQSVVIMHMRQWTTCEIHDVNGVCGRDFDTSSGGAAQIYERGTIIDGRWASAGPDKPFLLMDGAGKPVGILPGLSWVLLAE